MNCSFLVLQLRQGMPVPRSSKACGDMRANGSNPFRDNLKPPCKLIILCLVKNLKPNAWEASMDNSAEEITFGLIAYSGQARSAAYDALEKAKAGIFDEAAELMKTAEEAQLQAHNIQTELLTKEAQGKHTAVDVLLVHAQDHLMTSILAVELIQQIIELYQRLAEK